MADTEFDLHFWIKGEDADEVALYTITAGNFPIAYDVPQEQALDALQAYFDEKAEECSSVSTCEACGSVYDVDEVSPHETSGAEHCLTCHQLMVDVDEQFCHICAHVHSQTPR